MIFIDWLSIYQVYPPKSLPVIGDAVVQKFDLETGDMVYETIQGYQHEGSFDSALRVRCDGSIIEVSGNPSKFDRLDNVFGIGSIESCVEVYNRVLEQLGLPPFTIDESTYSKRLQRSDQFIDDGAKITRVDLTRNFSSGSAENALRALRWISSQTWKGRAAQLYPNGLTVDFPNARGKQGKRVYLKYYSKAGSLNLKWDNELDGEYCKKLKAWVEDVGLIRQEVSLKSNTLRENGLERIDRWEYQTMLNIIQKQSVHQNQGGALSDVVGEVAPRLIQQGVTPGQAGKCAGIVSLWLSGTNVRPLFPRSTFYKVRKQLLPFGIDISIPCDVSRFPIATQEVNLEQLEPPSWYRYTPPSQGVGELELALLPCANDPSPPMKAVSSGEPLGGRVYDLLPDRCMDSEPREPLESSPLAKYIHAKAKQQS